MKEKINFYLPKIIFILIVFAFGVWVGQSVALPFGDNRDPLIRIAGKDTPKEIQVDFEPFWVVWDTVTKDYLERNSLDPQTLLYGAISGMVEAVGDPYTVFLNPGENEEFELALSGTYEGVGIEIDIRDERLTVVAPIEGTPADRAGVQAGDKIIAINGEDTASITIQGAVQKIRGEQGSSVKLTLLRAGQNLDVEITREKIVIKSVEFEDLGGGVAKIHITRFGDSTLEEWKSAVSQTVSGSFNKLILDLRNNPGGRLDHAISVAGEFAPKGTTVVQEEDASGNRFPFKTANDPKLQNVEVVVLINKGSASASEIVAGALRDLKSAPLVGETSFGKGTVQRVDDLMDGSGLHLTFAKWLTPNGTWVNKEGLKPDVEVALTDEDRSANRDPQLDRAQELLQ